MDIYIICFNKGKANKGGPTVIIKEQFLLILKDHALHSLFKSVRFGALVLAISVLAHAIPLSGSALALTQVVPLKTLKIKDVVYLPTTHSQQEMQFTKPKTWSVASSSYIEVNFQHSHELLPNRSWLKVLVNNQVLANIALTPQNAEGTSLKVPLPVGILKDFNKLTFRVEQHYTDYCEDPLDPSLWTQILPSTKIVFDYTPALPSVELSAYPYPIIDPLTYSPNQIHYVIPQALTQKELQALGIMNAYLGQWAQKNLMKTSLSYAGEALSKSDEHLVYIGTPKDNPDFASLVPSLSNISLSGGQWIDNKTQQPLDPEAGLIFYANHPQFPHKAMVVITGNTDAAVLQAARYLTTQPKSPSLKDHVALAPPNWSPSAGQSTHKPRYIEKEDRTFAELGFPIQAVHKIYAPPINYDVPIVGDFRKDGTQLWVDLVYSYGPHLNPEFSSLEIRMNDISIGNIPLTNPEGETAQRASIPISNELIHTKNKLVAQFHMLPRKYGFCKNNFIDEAWGKIMDDSKFRVSGPVGSGLPDVSLLNETAYPYSMQDTLENVHLVLPNTLNHSLLQTFLGVTTRLGRSTMADTDLRLTVSQGNEVPKDKNLILIGSTPSIKDLQTPFLLKWIEPFLTEFKLDNGKVIRLKANGTDGYLEQALSPWDKNRVVTLISGTTEQAFNSLASLFEDDTRFENVFPRTALSQIPVGLNHFNSISYPEFYVEKQESEAKTPWYWHLPWLDTLWVLLGLFGLLIIFPLIIRKLKRTRY